MLGDLITSFLFVGDLQREIDGEFLSTALSEHTAFVPYKACTGIWNDLGSGDPLLVLCLSTGVFIINKGKFNDVLKLIVSLGTYVY
jgi:hypothetical protein